MPRIDVHPLKDFAQSLLSAGGVEEPDAVQVADSLVSANLRGHDSHGVMRIPFYLQALADGEVVTGAELTILKETPTVLVADANWGFGQTQARRLTSKLMDKAQRSGMGVGTVVQSSHIGRLGEFCEQAAESGLVSMIMVNTHGAARRIAPPGGKAPRLGTNPLAIGAPNDGEPLVLDFSTAATAEGKVRVKRIAGQPCPDGWLMDSEGRPTNDPNTLYGDPPGTILPLGGSQAYKGFGLGLMIEILCGAVSGGPCIREVPITPKGNCVFMMVLAPEHFGGREHYRKEVGDMAQFMRGCPRIDGVDRILLPGDPERLTLADRSANGIPLDEGNWSELVQLAERLKVPVAATR